MLRPSGLLLVVSNHHAGRERHQMDRDRMTQNRQPKGYDKAAAKSKAHLRNCRTMERYVEMGANTMMDCKWRTKKNTRRRTVLSNGYTMSARTYYTTHADFRTLDYLLELASEITDFDGDWNDDALEEYADRVALETLKRMGYRVAADADYDWVCSNLGANAEKIYHDIWNAVAEECRHQH